MKNSLHFVDSDLLSAIAKGDQYALVELFHRYYHQLGFEILGITGSVDIAEQAVQDAFVMAWVQQEALAEIKECWTYLLVISRNIALIVMGEQKMKQEGKSNGAPEHPLSRSRQMIKDTVEQLPPFERQIYKMATVDRLSPQETAGLLDVTADQVKTIIDDALRLIRMELSNHMEPCVVVVLTSVLVVGDQL
ncbi:DNA-directed RNA polymerase specialized sigma subunit, sigma24 family [Pedobacter westerhofensis]|uniref:DNA-directed RNA polymerase specialized sigma subunit, sigma24 family n=1 Tax=Pedobacter westerhofensis TaxID=425512 RepID=A0A521AU68_9SPHI|nr:sigma factor-like helix-turn-helix DNA-binding protein [Pedobacter westerhofensis]SMO38344.1 DNA-directed RNA polymerase specialized sigma subunit, sigma24 family [Pedobacter westerhofensis]